MNFLQNHKNCLKEHPSARTQASHPGGGGIFELNLIPRTSPGYRLLRRQSSQSGPCRSRRGLRKQDSIWPQRKKPRQERSGEHAGQFTGPCHLIQHPGYAASNVLRTSALKCAGDP
ncbi:hypothetical protein TNCV_934201 [Trichonephila clavipes]|nr:hypothetical protein TNCV_934201 [Trichonephila clavipes]